MFKRFTPSTAIFACVSIAAFIALKLNGHEIPTWLTAICIYIASALPRLRKRPKEVAKKSEG